ncbi:MAG: hypothetical protein K6A90_05370 [Lachnospiraceae bacterium]|nr:hypothetical protein [Lachnospiraceae bacterium]
MGRISKKTNGIISKTIDEMEPIMRSVVIGYFYNHLSVSELAKALLMSDAEIYGLMVKGKKLLREAIILNGNKDTLFKSNYYLYTEIFLSCGEEVVEKCSNTPGPELVAIMKGGRS